MIIVVTIEIINMTMTIVKRTVYMREDKNIDYEFADLIHEKQEGQRVKIKKHIIHPNYNEHKDGLSLFEYDIAIVITENIGEFINF